MNLKSNTLILWSKLLLFRKFIYFCLIVGNVLFFPLFTQAGIVSFISDLFSSQNASAQSESIIVTSSQNMNLPEPANNFNPTLKTNSGIIIDGGTALLSEAGPLNSAPENTVIPSQDQISVYVVRSGDNLAKIAEMFGVSVDTILWSNDLNSKSVIKVGQTLVILPVSGVMHTVVSGDTLSKIAKKYGGSIDEISSFNDLKNDYKLAIGDTIMIPDGKVSSSPASPASYRSPTSSSSGPAYEGYYIKPFIGGRKTQGIHGYNAVDYGMPIGNDLYASAAGTILISRSSGWNGGYGNYVVIKHPNNTQTVYGHMSEVHVTVGQKVSQGQIIGKSGNTGNSTGPHLHFEIRGAKNPF